MYVQNGYRTDPAWGMGPFISPAHLFSRSEVYSEPRPETAIVGCTDGENTVSFFPSSVRGSGRKSFVQPHYKAK